MDALYTIKNQDVLEAFQTINDDSIDLIVTSPPYNIGKSYEQRKSLNEYLDWQRKVIIQCIRVLKDGGSIYWQVGAFVDHGEIFPLDYFFYQIFKEYGLTLRNRIVWHFNHGLHAKKKLSGRYETILWVSKGSQYKFKLDPIRIPSKYPGKKHFTGEKKGLLSGNPLGKNPSDFWEFMLDEFDCGVFDIPNVKNAHPEKTIHPCQYPIELAERCILASSDENDYVLDPFVGTGATIIAALKNNRRCIGIEKEYKYCDIIDARVKQLYQGTLKTREIGTPIYAPKPMKDSNQITIDPVK